jgi:hypothetical protein
VKFNDPDAMAGVRAAFDAYEADLIAGRSTALDRYFVRTDSLVRYGVADLQHGIAELSAWRMTQGPFERQLERLVIATYGDDFATASTLFHRPDFPGEVGRQMQTWVRVEGEWKIAAAHVSMMPADAV